MSEEPWLPSDKPQGQVRIEDLVKPWVEGMTALVISNRMDPELEQRLSRKLGLDITWVLCDMRRAQSQAKAIAKNKYDLVIGQTGFLSHNVETILARACVANQVPYIRADKARPTSTAMALIRDLGIDITQKPPSHDRVVVSAPPQESKDGKIRRRTIVTLPQQPDEYKDLDIDLLKFLEKQDSYFRMEDALRSLRGVPIICGGDGKVVWTKMRAWTNAVGAMLRKLGYVNAQVTQAIDPNRPRVWVRLDRQYKLRGSDQPTPAEVARTPPPPRPADRRPQQNRSGLKWLRRYATEIRRFIKGRLYIHPEDPLRLIGVRLPESAEIVWQDHMFWTKNMAPILRKAGFLPRQRELPDGRKARVWIHKKAPRYLDILPPGSEYVDPVAHMPPSPPTRPKPRAMPAAQAPAQPHVHAGGAGVEFLSAPRQTPVPAPSTGPKAVRISFSSIEGGDMNELLLVLTQAGWAVSFGP